MTTHLQHEMRKALRAEFPLPGQANQPAYERLADAAHAAVEPLLRGLYDEIMAEITSGHLPDASVGLWKAIADAGTMLREYRPPPAADSGRCSECERPVYTPLDEKETRCAGCVKKEQDAKSSSGAVPTGFWDRTKKDG